MIPAIGIHLIKEMSLHNFSRKNKKSNKAITVPAIPFIAFVNVLPIKYSDRIWTIINARNKLHTTRKKVFLHDGTLQTSMGNKIIQIFPSKRYFQ